MELGPLEVSGPTALAAGYAAVVAVTLLVAASTTGAAFGAHNPGWEGLSEVRSVADDTGTDTEVVTELDEYRAIDPDGSVVLLVGPEETTSRQRAELRTFVAAGGTVVVASGDADVANRLLDTLGTELRVDGAPLRDEREHDPSPAFPVVTTTADHPYVRGADGLALNHGTALTVDGAGPPPHEDDVAARGEHVSVWAGHAAWGGDGPRPLANTSEFSYVDSDGDGTPNPYELLDRRVVVASESVGAGEVVAVSDPSAFINVMVEREPNRALVAGLLGEHERVVFDRTGEGVPPLVGLLLAIRDSATLSALAGLLPVAAVLGWERRSARGRRAGGSGSSVSLRRAAARRLRALLGRGPPKEVRPPSGSDEQTGERAATARPAAADPSPAADDDPSAASSPGGGRSGRADPSPDRAALAAYLRREHPELDERQRERVLGGIMGVDPERRDDDRRH